MTEPATTDQAPEPAAGPRLLHHGTYALYETADGGRHLSYRPAEALTEDGQMVSVAVGDQHLPDIPPAALPLVNVFLERGFPPAVLDLLGGKMSPMKILAAMRDSGLSANGDGAGNGD